MSWRDSQLYSAPAPGSFPHTREARLKHWLGGVESILSPKGLGGYWLFPWCEAPGGVVFCLHNLFVVFLGGAEVAM